MAKWSIRIRFSHPLIHKSLCPIWFRIIRYKRNFSFELNNYQGMKCFENFESICCKKLFAFPIRVLKDVLEDALPRRCNIQKICRNRSLENTSEKNGILLLLLVVQYSDMFASGIVPIFRITPTKAISSSRVTFTHECQVDFSVNCFSFIFIRAYSLVVFTISSKYQ